MLPQTPYNERAPKPHESINDLPVHPATRRQIFLPASESRHFTRKDAAKIFSPTLLPADARIPHPDLIDIERDLQSGMPREARLEAVRQRDEAKRLLREKKVQKKLDWERDNVVVVPRQRWDFRFQHISVEEAGRDGRGKRGVGWRYGAPHEDRKRGQVKIPTSVE